MVTLYFDSPLLTNYTTMSTTKH